MDHKVTIRWKIGFKEPQISILGRGDTLTIKDIFADVTITYEDGSRRVERMPIEVLFEVMGVD